MTGGWCKLHSDEWVLCIHKEENAVGSWAGDGGFKKEISFVSVRYFVQSVNILKYHFTNA